MVDVSASNNLYTSYLVNTFRGGVFELENHAIKMGLLRASYVPDKAHNDLADVTADELTGNGYSRKTLSNVLVSSDGVWVKASFDAVRFQATGGNLQAKYWYMFDDETPGGGLIAWGQIDVSRDDEVVLIDGFGVDIVVNELGLYRVPV